MNRLFYKLLLAGIIFGLAFESCKNNLPDDMDSLGDDVSYTVTEFTPVLGRNTFYSNILTVNQNTSQPLTFKIVNIKDVDGQPAMDLFSDKFPVKVWKEMYNGTEQSIAEIEAKRKVEYRPILEILEHSGNINFWNAGKSSFVKVQPDSGYTFDIQVENSGGRRFIRNFKLKPLREAPYSPSNLDPITGLANNPYVNASYSRNLIGSRTKTNIPASEIRVYFNKSTENSNPTKTLTISFLDSLNNPIDPASFNDTNWKKMIHGFNYRIENKKVVYDVAYPIPLTTYKTDYTVENGDEARIDVGFRKMDDFGILQRCYFGLNFSIYEEGNWEIQFRFSGETPLFN